VTDPARRPLWTTAAWTLVVAACAVSAVAGRLCFLARPLASDSAMFIYMGKLVAEGGRVGPDLVDNKFPTVGLMTSAAWRAFGTAWPAYVGLGAALSAIAAAALGAAAGRGRTATVLFALVFLNLAPAVFGGFQLETPIACFTSLAAMGAVRAIEEDAPAAAFVAGLAAGCAALLKPTGVGVLGAMAIGLAVRRSLEPRRREGAKMVDGRDRVLTAPTVHPLPPSNLSVSLRAFAPSRFNFSFSRQGRSTGACTLGTCALAGLAVPLSVAAAYLSAASLWGELPITAQRLSAYAEGSVFDAVSWVKLATVAALLGFPIVVRLVMSGLPAKPVSEVRRRPGSGTEESGSSAHLESGLAAPRPPAVLAFAVAWLAIELAGVIAQRRMYAYHFLPVVPPAALLFGLLPRPARPWPLLAALGPAAALSFCYALHVIAAPGEDRLPVGRYLQARAAAGDRVWADDWPRLMLETGLRPGSRQALTFLFANDDATAGADSAQIVADLDDRRPAFIVLPADLPKWLHRQTTGIVELAQHPTRAAAYTAGWRRIERYTLAHYLREAVVGDEAVYRRADPIVTADAR
jgi:hypothetical protein